MFNFLKKKKTLGLALSGGAQRGWAHIGALKALEQANIKVDFIAGTSIGALIGALYACGYSAKQMEEEFGKISILNFIDLKVSLRALSTSRKIAKELTKHLPVKTLGETNIPLHIVATDFLAAKKYVFNKKNDDLVTAICASMAIPNIFHPVRYKENVLVDGCLVENLPVATAKKMSADIVVGINLTPPNIPKAPENLGDSLTWTNDICINTQLPEAQSLAEFIINPIDSYIGTFYLENQLHEDLIKAGEKSMRKIIPQLKKIFRS